MDGGQLYGRGMSFPPRVGPDGRIAWSEGETNIRESIQIILLTEPEGAPAPSRLRRRPAALSLRAQYGRDPEPDQDTHHQGPAAVGAAHL